MKLIIHTREKSEATIIKEKSFGETVKRVKHIGVTKEHNTSKQKSNTKQQQN